MKILPTHLYSQVSTADNSIEEESKASSGGVGGGSMTLQIQDTYHESRISSIETIEKTLYDITTLFKRFATIVQEQQILVERIDSNTENALHDLEGAKTELRDVYEDTKSTRKLILKIFFILMIFTTLYILFVL
jgi:hypothetical protein